MDMDEILSKMRDYADVALDRAGKVGKAAVSKTENAVSKARLKYLISDTEDKIKDMYASMGEIIYNEYLIDGYTESKMEDACKKIDTLNKELSDLRQQLFDVSKTVKCDSCGAYNKTDAQFCAKCGAKTSASSVVDDDVTVYDEDEIVDVTIAYDEEK